MERTIALIKPDAVARKLTGRIISLIENYPEFSILHIETMVWSLERARYFYGRQHDGKPYFDELCMFMSGKILVAMVLNGDEVIAKWRNLMGPNDPALRMGYQIRRRFQVPGARMMENLVHGSDSPESYDHESLALAKTFVSTL